MTAIASPKGPAVLVTWVSVNHRAAPLLAALGEAASPLRGRIDKVYLCWRSAPGADGGREREAVEETVSKLHRELGKTPLIEPVPWSTRAPPTDHAAIQPFAEEVLRKVRERHPGAHLYINLSPGTPAMHAIWLMLGATGFIEGPVTLVQGVEEKHRARGASPLVRVNVDLETWLQRYRRSRPNKAGVGDHGRIWDPARVKSHPLREALESLARWAPLRAPVLLTGERGCGKTTLANFLRSMSPFQREGKGDWPVVVCGQFRVNPELARSELFGHARGAFTGASSDRKGLLEDLDGDTLFLDEIADIDRDTQRLLIAAVEGRGFQRLGDAKIRQSQFRLVSATNRPLDEIVGTVLDPDFFDRIAVFTLRVPPLRECREDLPDTWREVLRGAASSAANSLSIDRWAPFAEHPGLLRAIEDHPLPGNLRDLQRVAIHLLAAVNAGDSNEEAVRRALAALAQREGRAHKIPSVEMLRARLPLREGLDEHVAAYRRQWIEAALSQADGNVSKAARLVGVKRETFRGWANAK